MKQEKQGKNKKHRKALDIIAIIVMIVAIGIFAYAAYQLYLIFAEYRAGEQEYDALREFVQVSAAEEKSIAEAGADRIIQANEIPECPITVDFQALKTVNHEIKGWLYIEAIPNISYPIVQGTDNNFYLTHTVERVRNFSASIFMDYRNASDFSDSNSIIYGHNMKNQSMFGLLKKLKSSEVYEKSPYIWILTAEEDICYEIFSVRDVSETDNVYNDLVTGPEEFKEKLERYQAASQVESNLAFDGTEQIITLSTCTSNDTVRCIVQAVRKEF